MNWLVIGKSGTGKSYFAKRLADRLSEGKKLIIVDNSEDHADISGVYLLEVHQENIRKLDPRKVLQKLER